jgi:hypothetical protein
MVIVLITARYAKILDWLCHETYEDISSIGIIKRDGPKVYLYVETDLSFHQICQQFKSVIKRQGGLMYVYEFYSLYHGMIDYNAYLSKEIKDNTKYYQSSKKDITEAEIELYKKKH